MTCSFLNISSYSCINMHITHTLMHCLIFCVARIAVRTHECIFTWLCQRTIFHHHHPEHFGRITIVTCILSCYPHMIPEYPNLCGIIVFLCTLWKRAQNVRFQIEWAGIRVLIRPMTSVMRTIVGLNNNWSLFETILVRHLCMCSEISTDCVPLCWW